MNGNTIGRAGTALLVVACACARKPLQMPDASGGGGSFETPWDGGGTWDIGDPTDAPWDTTFAGRRSFVVTSQVHTDAGVLGPGSHRFTMILDSDQRIAIVGANGGGELR